jgi:N-acetylglucosaminyl-diphospho-decaprenol L-rhamnosyltransferase
VTALPISVITVGYRGAPLLARCLDSLLRADPPPAEVIVVDNDSPEDLSGVMADFEKRAAAAGISPRMLRAPRNLGFGQGNAFGLAQATQKHIMLLNPDTEVEAGTLSRLLGALEALPAPVAVQPLIVFAGNRSTINSAGIAAFLDGGFVDMLCDAPRDLLKGTEPIPIAAGTGAALLMRREDIDRFGFFDPDFFLYVEDVDLGLRWRRAGAEVFLVPGAIVYHEYHGSTGPSRNAFAFEISSNQIETALKNFPTADLAPSAILWTYNTLRLLGGRGPELGRARLRSALQILRRRRTVMDKRRRVRATGPDDRVSRWIVSPKSAERAAPPQTRG